MLLILTLIDNSFARSRQKRISKRVWSSRNNRNIQNHFIKETCIHDEIRMLL